MGFALKDDKDFEVLRKIGTPTAQAGNDEFAAIRQKLDDMEQGRNAAGVPALVTAPVTTRRRRRTQAQSQNERSMQMNQTTPTATQGPKFEDLLAKAKEYGADRAQGADAQVKFALMVMEAGYLGTVDLTPHKHGQNRRDGMVLAETYVRARTGATVFDTKSDSARKLISNLDKCIKLGGDHRWGGSEPMSTVNDLLRFRQSEKKAGSKKLDDAFNTLMRFATAQLKSDTMLTGPALQAFVYRRETEARDAEDVLDSVRKMLTKLTQGKVANCHDADASAEVKAAIKQISTRLTNIAKSKGAAQNGPASATAPQQATA